ncbi:MAG: hypothetical protein HXX17_08255 [Geobacteraceae bacterium]|nr:hypothetical protein [Geobacteraceae bacterium]
MTQSIQLGRFDGGADLYNGTATAGQITIAAQTTLVAATTTVQSGIAVATPITGSTALALPMNSQVGSPIVITNTAATAVSLLVFPPWNNVTGAVAGGKIYGAAAALPSANASITVAQGRSVALWPHANGIDYTAIWSAVA